MTVADAAATTIAAVSHAASSGGDTHAMVSKIILQLLLAFAAAKITGYIFEKINQPVVFLPLLEWARQQLPPYPQRRALS